MSRPEIERRQFTRFPVRTATITIDNRSGRLADISFGGLSFYYLDDPPWPREESACGLIFGKDDFCLSLPMETVSDQPAQQQAHPRLRRRSVRFGALSADQILQLIAFIRGNTDEPELFVATG